MAKKLKTPVPVPEVPPVRGESDVEAALARLALLDADLSRVEADLTEAVTRAREEFEPQATRLKAERDATVAVLEAWARANRKNMFGGIQSREFVHGRLIFQLGKRTVIVEDGFKPENCVAALQGIKRHDMVRVKFELDKDAVLRAEAANEITPRELAACHLRVGRVERFEVEPKVEEVPDGATL